MYKALNETSNSAAYEVKRKVKFYYFTHQDRTPPVPTLSKLKGKNGDMRKKKGVPHRNQETKRKRKKVKILFILYHK